MRILLILFVSTFALLANASSNAKEYGIVEKSSNVMEWTASNRQISQCVDGAVLGWGGTRKHTSNEWKARKGWVMDRVKVKQIIFDYCQQHYGVGVFSWAEDTRNLPGYGDIGCKSPTRTILFSCKIKKISEREYATDPNKKETPKIAQKKEREFKKEKKINPDDILPASSGSGFAVSKQGHIVTNNHVIDGCNEIKIYKNENTFSALLVQNDRINDLAILKANITPTVVFSISESNANLLQEIYVAGYPFGSEISNTVKVTKGIVSSVSGPGNNFSQMQIDASLQPGNSGGPIVDKRWNVVGVAVAKADAAYFLKTSGVLPENINFGIKSNVLKNFLEANRIKINSPSIEEISQESLGEKISEGTVFLSCWMDRATIQKMRSKKVLFPGLD